MLSVSDTARSPTGGKTSDIYSFRQNWIMEWRERQVSKADRSFGFLGKSRMSRLPLLMTAAMAGQEVLGKKMKAAFRRHSVLRPCS